MYRDSPPHSLPADHEHYTRILFLPPALTNRQDELAGSSPRRSLSGRSQTPGRTPSRMPPPPPRNSIFEDPVSTGDWRHAPPESPRVATASATPGQYPESYPGTPGLIAESDRRVDVYHTVDVEDEWVTVFGVTQNDMDLILKEFYSCGEIETSGTFGGPPTANWINIQYKTKDGARRALSRNGDLIDGRLIVGVTPLSTKDRAVIEKEVGLAQEDGPSPSTSSDVWTPQHGIVTGPAVYTPYPRRRSTIPIVYTETPSRDLQVDTQPSPISQGPLQQADDLPTPAKGWLSPFKEFILGT